MWVNFGRRRGVTLVELLVVLVILGLSTSVVMLAWRQDVAPSAEMGELRRRIGEARRRAISSGRPQRLTFLLSRNGALTTPDQTDSDAAPYTVTALPDGGVLADYDLRFDRLLGTPLESAGAR